MKNYNIIPPKFDFKNVALYHIANTRYSIYNDIQLFSNSNYDGKELVVHELERVFNQLSSMEQELKNLKESSATA